MNKGLALGLGVLVGLAPSIYALVKILNLNLEIGKLNGKIKTLNTQCDCLWEILEDEKRLSKILDEKLLETDEDLRKYLEDSDTEVKELKTNVEKWSKEMDELNRETDETIEKARKHQVAAEALLKEFDELEADS